MFTYKAVFIDSFNKKLVVKVKAWNKIDAEVNSYFELMNKVNASSDEQANCYELSEIKFTLI